MHFRAALSLSTMLLGPVDVGSRAAGADPPRVEVPAKNRADLSRPVSNRTSADAGRATFDGLPAATGKPLRRSDGSFRVGARRRDAKTPLTVVGCAKGDSSAPRRNAWLSMDPAEVDSWVSSQVAPGRDGNLPLGCRLASDRPPAHDSVMLPLPPVAHRPTDFGRNGEAGLHVMATAREVMQDGGKEGRVANDFVRHVLLDVRGR